jgi:hypothetical protein
MQHFIQVTDNFFTLPISFIELTPKPLYLEKWRWSPLFWALKYRVQKTPCSLEQGLRLKQVLNLSFRLVLLSTHVFFFFFGDNFYGILTWQLFTCLPDHLLICLPFLSGNLLFYVSTRLTFPCASTVGEPVVDTDVVGSFNYLVSLVRNAGGRYWCCWDLSITSFLCLGELVDDIDVVGISQLHRSCV